MFKVLIVEDDRIFAKDLEELLSRYDCTVVGKAYDGREAIRLFDALDPELVLLDIVLGGDIDGVAVAEHINRHRRVPFIYMTDYYGAEHRHFKKAVDTRPANYLPKAEFLPKQLWHFVEVALLTFDRYENGALKHPTAFSIDEYIFLKRGIESSFQKVFVTEIVYIEVSKPYCKIFVKEYAHPFFVRKSLSELLAGLPSGIFVQVHRSYAVNKEVIIKINSTKGELLTPSGVVPIGKTYRTKVYAMLSHSI